MVAVHISRVGYRRHVFDQGTQAVPGLLEKLLPFFHLRDVLHDLRESPRFAPSFVEHLRYRAGQEPGSILALEKLD